jgi:hypothetical protein
MDHGAGEYRIQSRQARLIYGGSRRLYPYSAGQYEQGIHVFELFRDSAQLARKYSLVAGFVDLKGEYDFFIIEQGGEFLDLFCAAGLTYRRTSAASDNSQLLV